MATREKTAEARAARVAEYHKFLEQKCYNLTPQFIEMQATVNIFIKYMTCYGFITEGLEMADFDNLDEYRGIACSVERNQTFIEMSDMTLMNTPLLYLRYYADFLESLSQ